MQTDGHTQQPEKTAKRRPHQPRTERRWPHPRDLEVLRWTCEQYAARMDHVIALIGCSRPTAQLTSARLRNAGFVTTRRFMVGEPMWLLPTWRGLTAAGVHGAPWDPTVSRLAHLAAINQVRLHIQARTPDARWIGNRQLRSEHAKTRPVLTGYAKHLPDGVGIHAGMRVACKVELHFKGRVPTEAVLDQLARRYDATLCFCDHRPYGELLRLAQSGRWPTLEVRPLPGAEWSAAPSPARQEQAQGGDAR
jgi:hypothetical protein